MTAQLDFFTDSETELLRFEIEELRKAQANMRRGLFARLGDLSKLVMLQQQEIESLKGNKGFDVSLCQPESDTNLSQEIFQ